MVSVLLVVMMLALPPAEAPLERVAFGSCAHQGKPQPIWDVVAAREPDVFLLIGDAVYARSFDPAVLGRTLEQLLAKPGFQRLRERIPVLAVWDDNDYGTSDSGAEHPNKDAAQRVFLDAFDQPADSARRDRAGMYGSWTFGPAGQRTQIVVLDTRYHRTALASQRVLGRPFYVPTLDPDATVLGDAQWAWLERTLAEPAELRLIVSSTQVIPDNHPGEKWANFPRDRQRLLDLLAKTDAGVLLLTGDQHLGELSRLPRSDMNDLLELTASGLTHTRTVPAPNRYRVSEIVLAHHFGEVTIDWSAADPQVTLAIVSVDGEVVLRETLGLAALRPQGQ